MIASSVRSALLVCVDVRRGSGLCRPSLVTHRASHGIHYEHFLKRWRLPAPLLVRRDAQSGLLHKTAGSLSVL